MRFSTGALVTPCARAGRDTKDWRVAELLECAAVPVNVPAHVLVERYAACVCHGCRISRTVAATMPFAVNASQPSGRTGSPS